jgi:GNAT superfamily N-acetyltransferase
VNKPALVIREIDDPSDPAIAAFGRMQLAAYFAPETLIPASYIPRMIAGDAQFGGRRNFLLVAELHGKLVGGALFHWLTDAQTGFSSFMGVDRAKRGHGIGRRLHDERFHVLDRAAGHRVQGVFIDVVNPSRLSSEDVEREQRVGSDPWERRKIFKHLGFRQVDIRYEQPVGGPNGGPVTNLDLLYCPRDPVSSIPTSLVVSTMRAYWSGWLGASTERHVHELEQRAYGAQQLALISPVPDRTAY